MHNLEKLRHMGAIVPGPAGERVRISIQYVPRLAGLTWQDRETALKAEFAKLSTDPIAAGVEMEAASVSITGQTVKAHVAVDAYDRLVGALDPARFRVDPLINREAAL